MTQPFSKELAQEIFAHIKEAKSILLHCHRHADADSLGSTLGLKHSLETIGKKVTLIQGDTPIPSYISHLPGADKVVQKNYFEIDITQFDLFLILDTGSLDRVSGIKPIEFPKSLKTITIDHHKTNPGYADINLVDSSYPATSQIVFDLVKEWGIEITHDTALCLYAGIYTDTGGFTYRSANLATYKVVTQLVEKAPDFSDMMFKLQNNNTPGKLRVEGLLLASIETWCNDSVAVASSSYEDLKKMNVTPDDIASTGITNLLKSVVGWNIAMNFIEKEPGVVGVSLRTRDDKKWDVSKIAVSLGGGGHAAAAGVQLQGTISEAKAKLKQAISETYPNLS